MTKEKKEPMFQSGEMTNKLYKRLYSIDPEMSLLSVNFATTENPYLNEHYQNDLKDKEKIKCPKESLIIVKKVQVNRVSYNYVS